MFLCGLILAALIAVLTLLSPESSSWQKNRLAGFAEVTRILWHHKKDFVYLVLMMTAITCLSHGTQDLYPDFLKTVHGFSNTVISNLAILYNVGAIAGALVIGHYSDVLGRRYSDHSGLSYLCALDSAVGLRLDDCHACDWIVRDAIRRAGSVSV